MEEGYIKFKSHWVKGPVAPSDEIKELIQTRNYLFNRNWIGEYPDSGIGFGNLSMRDTSVGKGFWVSGTRTGGIKKMGGEGFTFVRDWDLDTNELWSCGPVEASSESITHALCYESDSNVKVVIHVHHLRGWKKWKHVLPTTSVEVEYGTVAMAKEIERIFRTKKEREKQVIIMGGHEEGILAFGATFREVISRLEKYLGG